MDVNYEKNINNGIARNRKNDAGGKTGKIS